MTSKQHNPVPLSTTSSASSSGSPPNDHSPYLRAHDLPMPSLSRYTSPDNASFPDPRRLLRWESNAIKSRRGAVLSRGFILKNDSYGSGRVLDLEFKLQGAPNFRSLDFNVYASAQPTSIGLRTILSALGSKSQPGNTPATVESVWVCTREEPVVYIGSRPFVLRDSAKPTQTFNVSDRGKNLESIENRLKEDVIAESRRYGGVILVQDELATGEIITTWIAADHIFTVREMFDNLIKENFSVQYHRIPISTDQNPEDNYLDLFLSVMSKLPISTPVIFNCGAGVVRSTFASVAGVLIRRQQSIATTNVDPFAMESPQNRLAQSFVKSQSRDKSLLKLMEVMQTNLSIKSHSAAIELLTRNPKLLESLRNALVGNYETVLSLLPSLEHGTDIKTFVDTIVDHCDVVVNLREDILAHRLKYASVAMNEEEAKYHFRKTVKGLERYILTIAFAAFLEETSPSKESHSFLTWIEGRNEIKAMISHLRKSRDVRVLAPVHDLSAISRGSVGQIAAPTASEKAHFAEVTREGGEVVGDEWAHSVVSNRSGITLRAGTILKRDIWHAETVKETDIRGALNFRRAKDSNVFALAQPSEDGIDGTLAKVHECSQVPNPSIVWINLREEPLIYIAGYPYVLRSDVVTLRNIQAYSGISTSRLELIEDRLKADILKELEMFDGRILLHFERDDGQVVPVWESVAPQDVKTLREIMQVKENSGTNLSFRRIPVTAEAVAPDYKDLEEILEIVLSKDMDSTSIIVNCQLGRGRSTIAQVIIILIQQWLRLGGTKGAFGNVKGSQDPKSLSYQVINNLLRLIRNGREIKIVVDQVITRCNEYLDLVDIIEDSRIRAEEIHDDTPSTKSSLNPQLQKKSFVSKGMLSLKRYFFLIEFAAYLNHLQAETSQSMKDTMPFNKFLIHRPEFGTIYREIDFHGIASLSPLGQYEGGSVTADEIEEVVASRSGRILSTQTILKSDYFSKLQKMSLPERIEGAPNFRRVRLYYDENSAMVENLKSATEEDSLVFGCGMPSVEGMRQALTHMDAGPNGSRTIFWTSMREEPVLYVNGRPHVLRLLHAPLENVVTTGVKSGTVEAMEVGLKNDILKEMENWNGKVLLHDELENQGQFELTAEWEVISTDSILTPHDVFQQMKDEGYRVNYERVPVTDEQAPIPGVFGMLEERVSNALVQPNVSLAFNCQMGRGRTTTAMIAAALVANIIVSPKAMDVEVTKRLEQSFHIDEAVELVESTSMWDGDREDQPYLNGEYKIILQLVGVLQFGSLAKKITDKVIDAMDGVQNLRKSILDNKLRAEAAEPGSRKKDHLMHVTRNYLYRYGALIAFASYLFERTAAVIQKEKDNNYDDLPAWFKDGSVVTAFPRWLAEHREVSHVLTLQSLD